MFAIILFFAMLQGPQIKEVESTNFSIMFFFSPDCPSCREIAPFIEYLQEEYEVRIYAYNTRNPVGFRYGMQHEIRYVPTMIIMIGEGEGKIVNRYEGSNEIHRAEELIAELAANKPVSPGED